MERLEASQATTSSPDIWLLVFEQLIGDYTTLLSVSLVSRFWNSLSCSALLHKVDLSSHNIERRLTEHETLRQPVIYSSHHAKYRPSNLVPRQRKFLELIARDLGLAKHVKSFTWTLVWKDVWGDDHLHVPLQDIDRETWSVFARLTEVTHLDLASIHDIWEEPITRGCPSNLFPKVTHLRLSGWMHRGLVESIINSIDRAKLRSLTIHSLEDQGGLPGGHPISSSIVERFCKPILWKDFSHPREDAISQDLLHRQKIGQAAIFPGPMWYPFHLLSSPNLPLSSLSHFQISISTPNPAIDTRAFPTLFHALAMFLQKASTTLESLTILLGESPRHFALSSTINRNVILPWSIRMAAMLLKLLLGVLEECEWPRLKELTFEGFHLLEHEAAGQIWGEMGEWIKKCRFDGVDFTGKRHIDGKLPFLGFDCVVPTFDEELLRDS